MFHSLNFILSLFSVQLVLYLYIPCNFSLVHCSLFFLSCYNSLVLSMFSVPIQNAFLPSALSHLHQNTTPVHAASTNNKKNHRSFLDSLSVALVFKDLHLHYHVFIVTKIQQLTTDQVSCGLSRPDHPNNLFPVRVSQPTFDNLFFTITDHNPRNPAVYITFQHKFCHGI